LELSKLFAASLQRFLSYINQYGSNWMLNVIFLGKFIIVITQLPCLIRMADAVSSTVELVNSVTSVMINRLTKLVELCASRVAPLS
jgi:hypothetical protein